MVVVGRWLVLVLGLLVGLGAVPLWALVQLPAAGLALGAGNGLGALVGHVAIYRFVLRLGAVAAGVRLSQRHRPYLVWAGREHWVRFRAGLALLFVCAHKPVL
jgi:hypothetical protein